MKARIPYKMNSSERKAMRDEINRQIIESDKEYTRELDAAILWTLHISFGFGEKRLKKFWDCFNQEHQKLRERYELPPEDDEWLYSQLLKEHIGIDLEKWYQEQRGDDNDKR